MIRKRGRSWNVQVYAGTTNGKKKWLSRTAPTFEDAKKLERTLKGEIDRGKRRAPGKTFNDLLKAWLEQNEADWSPSTLWTHRQFVTNRIGPALGKTPLARLGTADIDGFYRSLTKSGLKASSVRRIHNAVRSALKQGVDWGWLPDNPAARARVPKPDDDELDVPSPLTVRQLLQAAAKQDEAFACFLRLAAVTGARRGELCALRWRDIDLTEGTVAIRAAVVDGGPGVGLKTKTTKTKERHTVSIDPATVAALEHYRHASGIVTMPSAHVFSHAADGQKPWRPDYATHRFTRLRDQLKVDVHLHSLRHFAATTLGAEGADVKTIQHRLGHKRASTTMDMYMKKVDAGDRKASTTLADVIDGAS